MFSSSIFQRGFESSARFPPEGRSYAAQYYISVETLPESGGNNCHRRQFMLMTVPGSEERREAGPVCRSPWSWSDIVALRRRSLHAGFSPPKRRGNPSSIPLFVSTPQWRRPASILLSATQTRGIHIPWRLCVTTRFTVGKCAVPPSCRDSECRS